MRIPYLTPRVTWPDSPPFLSRLVASSLAMVSSSWLTPLLELISALDGCCCVSVPKMANFVEGGHVRNLGIFGRFGHVRRKRPQPRALHPRFLLLNLEGF